MIYIISLSIISLVEVEKNMKLQLLVVLMKFCSSRFVLELLLWGKLSRLVRDVDLLLLFIYSILFCCIVYLFLEIFRINYFIKDTQHDTEFKQCIAHIRKHP